MTGPYGLTVNGRRHEVVDGWVGESLLFVLRERLGLPGSKNACEEGECGSARCDWTTGWCAVAWCWPPRLLIVQ